MASKIEQSKNLVEKYKKYIGAYLYKEDEYIGTTYFKIMSMTPTDETVEGSKCCCVSAILKSVNSIGLTVMTYDEILTRNDLEEFKVVDDTLELAVITNRLK